MSIEFLRINQGDLIPLSQIKRLSEINPKERESLANLGNHIDATAYGARIDYMDGSKNYVLQSLSDFQIQGAKLVKIKEGSFVLADNITKARNLTHDDREKFEAGTGRKLSDEFVSQIELKGGRVSSIIDAVQILRAINQPQRPVSAPSNRAEDALDAQQDRSETTLDIQ